MPAFYLKDVFNGRTHATGIEYSPVFIYSGKGVPTLKRYNCIDINENTIGEKFELFGWVQIKREHGGVVFADLRDRTGIVQLVFNEEYNGEQFSRASGLKPEYVIRVQGEVRKRENPNPNIPTGMAEVWVNDFSVLNTSKTPPIGVIKQEDVSEELRLKYRYLDLRRSRMKDNIVMRHRITTSVNGFLNEAGFINIETPFLTKSTPEGARDFLVPSRLNRGRFYALPQSPQIFKQLLMVSGFERYYQIVRCFRDEDLRADRQPEFTQIDIEASFIEATDIYGLIDSLFSRVLEECYGIELKTPVERMEYETAIQRYGTDRPDLRFGLQIEDLSGLEGCKPKQFILEKLDEGKIFRGIAVNSQEIFSRKVLDGLSARAKEVGIDLFTWAKVSDGRLSGPMVKLFESDILPVIAPSLGEGPAIVIAALGDKKLVLTLLGEIRTDAGKKLDLAKKKDLRFCWITDFPLFEWSGEENKLVSVHHPFTAPHGLGTEDMDKLIHTIREDPYAIKSSSYDFVLNGMELGGGSIRIHRSELQRAVFSVLGLDDVAVQAKFGFLLEALDYGAPPHGGIAFGLDRIVMMLQGEDSIRDVIPFPKTTSGTSPLSGAPDAVSGNQLAELGLKLTGEP